MNLCTGHESAIGMSRRHFLSKLGMAMGGLALSDMLTPQSLAQGILGAPHITPKAKRVIFLFQSGGPSQLDLFDHKTTLNKQHGKELPDSVRKGQVLTGMSGNQSTLPLVGSPFKFKKHGQSDAEFSELIPNIAGIANDICVIKSLYTEAINHGPGVTMMQTGSQLAGRPSIGSWLSYGLGSENQDLPDFVVMNTKGKSGQPLVSRLWGSGFLPGKHDGVRFRPDENAVLYLNLPNGVSASVRRKALDALNAMHQQQLEKTSDPELETRIAQYEMAFRMQTSVPEVTDLSQETEATFKLYGEDSKKTGTYAANCLMARRLAERGVKFIQLYHQGWDQHGSLTKKIAIQCRETDQASAALVTDLKQRGMLDDTLVIWGGEFGRTNYSQGALNANFGRDHHPRCFTIWMAGGGIKPGITHGETDDYGYNVVSDGVHIHDLHATMMHQLGINHEQLTYKYQGRHFRLTDVHGHVIKEILT